MKNKAMQNILIAGGSGFVGRYLCEHFTYAGYNVKILSRKLNQTNAFYWDGKTEIDHAAIDFADIVINLCGESISDKRWTKKRKNELISSRVNPIKLLYKSFKNKPIHFLSVSGVGIYPYSNSGQFNEESNPGNHYLSSICLAWEKEINKFNNYTVFRLPMVLHTDGGALENFKLPIKLKTNVLFGNGLSKMSWVFLEDVFRGFLFAIENNVNGVYNLTATKHTTQKELNKVLSNAISKYWITIKIPRFIVKIIFGKMSDLFLKSQEISSEKIKSKGFKLKNTQIKDIEILFNKSS